MTDGRVHPPAAGEERRLLEGFLDYHRQTLRVKIDGLDETQLALALPPSDMTLGGMVKHLALVEHAWCHRFAGRRQEPPWSEADWTSDPDWEWHSAADDTRTQLLALLDAEAAAADAIYAVASLDDLAVNPLRHTETHVSLRWILLHLIEEYARHNGHADLIRQSIDGAVGE